MPSTIPYDPSLILGNIVSQDKLDNLVKISTAQAPADAAQDNLNSLISMKRSMEMTIQELMGMGVDTSALIAESEQIGKQVQTAAEAYGKAKLQSEKAIQPLKAKIRMVDDEIESPIDYNRSDLKQMPLAADTLNMDCQYFSYDKNKQDSNSQAATVAGYVSEHLKIFGEQQSSQASGSVQSQVNSQYARHDITGTLVVAITCTHKNALVFAPYYMDVDKAVRAWNALFPSDMIKTNSPESIAAIEAKSDTKADESFSILSGATFGSSFVAMVHVLNTTTTRSNQDMVSVAASMQETFDVGSWFEENQGGFGVNSTFSDSVKNLLSMQNIQSHCSIVTMGIIPSLKSNPVKIAVESFANDDPQQDMQSLATLQNATAGENDSVASSATKARTGEQMLKMKNATITATLSGLQPLQEADNKIIDINSVMTALDDYVTRCVSGGDNLGVPINYYLKPISQSEIARAWLAKYYPNKFNQAGSADDSTSSSADSGSSTTTNSTESQQTG